mmetsp:Transcript_52582/g.162804  ORF Transcript_52582/g.162804 Transcript_52582/m.162804 type:complete len:257 (+) Transcript_52582:442-1212(+)
MRACTHGRRHLRGDGRRPCLCPRHRHRQAAVEHQGRPEHRRRHLVGHGCRGRRGRAGAAAAHLGACRRRESGPRFGCQGRLEEVELHAGRQCLQLPLGRARGLPCLLRPDWPCLPPEARERRRDLAHGARQERCRDHWGRRCGAQRHRVRHEQSAPGPLHGRQGLRLHLQQRPAPLGADGGTARKQRSGRGPAGGGPPRFPGRGDRRWGKPQLAGACLEPAAGPRSKAWQGHRIERPHREAHLVLQHADVAGRGSR